MHDRNPAERWGEGTNDSFKMLSSLSKVSDSLFAWKSVDCDCRKFDTLETVQAGWTF